MSQDATDTAKAARDAAATQFKEDYEFRRFPMIRDYEPENCFCAGWDARDEEVRRLKRERGNGVLVPESELKEMQAENKRLREALEKTKAFLYRCDCECDEYNGFRCGIHDAREIVDRALAPKEQGR